VAHEAIILRFVTTWVRQRTLFDSVISRI